MTSRFNSPATLLLSLGLLLSTHTATAQQDELLITLGFASAPSFSEESSQRGAYLPLWVAQPRAFTRETGYYLNVGIPEAELFKSSDVNRHSVTVVSAGLTYQVTDNVYLFGGPGYSYQRQTFFNYDTQSRHRLNGNIGIAFIGEKFGVHLNYDSGPNAFGIGFVTRTRWLGN
ncbi:MAG: hypothetical protein LAT77_11640 [Aliidiomarina sp.]|uniref:hypothetical protein n=1 Tax=Aliidiomarina sp. TaxID=1872439 RepID=UPI0025C706ED|nr:hypothetical protein [Aliidiomarina sp.]MCH8502548.1 hypothetical protein [Aliidiomarina sp.]